MTTNTRQWRRLWAPMSLVTLINLSGCAATSTSLAEPTALVSVAAQSRLSAEAAQADISLAKQALMDIHPGYDRYADPSELDELWDALEASVGKGTSDRALYVKLSRLLTEIRCDHTKAELPDSLEQSRMNAPSFFPFRPIVTGDGVLVFSAAEGVGLLPGDRLLSINGMAMNEIVETVLEMIPVDGYTDDVKPVAFEATGEFIGSAFEHFYPLHFGDWSSATAEIARNGERKSVILEPINWDAWRDLKWMGPAYRTDFVDAVQFDMLEDGVGYLRIDTFVNYRKPVDPAEVYGPVFEQLKSDGVETLIIDTRHNGGGSTDAVIGLIGFLTDDTSPLFAAKQVKTIDLSAYSDVIDTWDPRALTPDPSGFTTTGNGWFSVRAETDPIALGPIPAQSPKFEGEVILLTSRANASGVTMLLSTLRDRIGARLIGEATGGSSEGPTAGQIFFLKLPNSGIRLRIPWQLQSLNVASFEPGRGVTPDIRVDVTASDRLAGLDPVLAEAVRQAQRD